jgi:hypothetical protein
MKISAYSYVRNGFTLAYPFIQSIQSVLPIVDEFIMVIGDSNDGSREAVMNLQSEKIKIIDTVWDMNLRTGGKLFAQQANLGLDQTTGDWIIHIQADEVIHENDIYRLKDYIFKYDKDKRVQGLLFPFLNFRGDYNHINTGRKSHRFEIRAFRRNPLIRSYKDSQGFRTYSSMEAYEEGEEKGEKLKVVKIDIPIYHYSFVRPPKLMTRKAEVFLSFYNDDQWIEKNIKKDSDFDYNAVDRLDRFTGTHPKLMEPVIKKMDWDFVYDPSKSKASLRHRLLNKIEQWTGYRIGEYKNYRIIS